MAELSQTDPFIGSEIDGRFTVGERLGSGGMGAVYRARQHSVERDVAIKIITPAQAADPEAARRFLREAKLASSLSHPNTVAILDFGQTPSGVLFLVMELLRGKTLAEVLEADGNFSLARTAWVGVQLCDALEAAHRRSIVHRDLKPSNILVLDDPPGRDLVKVLDFGLARSLVPDDANPATITGQVMGTPRYMAPERLLGDPGDERADLFSLGVILFYALSGKHPYPAALMRLDQSPVSIGGDVPPVLENVLRKLVNADPVGRYPSAATAREALTAAMEQCAPSAVSRLRAQNREVDGVSGNVTRAVLEPAARRRPRVPLLVGALALVVVSAGALGSGLVPGFVSSDATATPTPTPTVLDFATMPEVEIEIDARPQARVFLDGEDLGMTPVFRRFPRASRSLQVELRRAGHRTEHREIGTDRSRSLSVDLTPETAASPVASRTPEVLTPTPTPTESFIVPGRPAPSPKP